MDRGVYMSVRSLRLILFLFAFMFFSVTSGERALAESSKKSQLSERNDMLEAASEENGHEISLACNACHTFDKGGPDKVGPNLFGIIGSKRAHEKRYPYSQALLKMSHQVWTIDALDKWLKSPATFAPGTKMPYGGLLDPQDRADVIAYLLTLKE